MIAAIILIALTLAVSIAAAAFMIALSSILHAQQYEKIVVYEGSFEAIQENDRWFGNLTIPILNNHTFPVNMPWLYTYVYYFNYSDGTSSEWNIGKNKTVNITLPPKEYKAIEIIFPSIGLAKEPINFKMELKGYVPETDNPIDLIITLGASTTTPFYF